MPLRPWGRWSYNGKESLHIGWTMYGLGPVIFVVRHWGWGLEKNLEVVSHLVVHYYATIEWQDWMAGRTCDTIVNHYSNIDRPDKNHRSKLSQKQICSAHYLRNYPQPISSLPFIVFLHDSTANQNLKRFFTGSISLSLAVMHQLI